MSEISILLSKYIQSFCNFEDWMLQNDLKYKNVYSFKCGRLIPINSRLTILFVLKSGMHFLKSVV